MGLPGKLFPGHLCYECKLCKPAGCLQPALHFNGACSQTLQEILHQQYVENHQRKRSNNISGEERTVEDYGLETGSVLKKAQRNGEVLWICGNNQRP